MRTIIAMLSLVALVGCFFVFWFVALVSAIRRQDLKHDKIVWLLVIFLVPFGHLIYLFMEDRKKYGVLGLVLPLIAGTIVVAGLVMSMGSL